MQQDPAGLGELAELSSAEGSQLESELGYDYELLTAAKEISDNLREPDTVYEELNSRSMTVKGSTVTLMDPKALDQFIERSDPSSRGLLSSAQIIKAVVKIAARVISRFIHKRDHGLHATIVEEILHALYLANVGGAIWKTMKKDTADSFGPDPQVHGGSAFLDALKNHADPANPPRVILIGHSTGAVYISEFIKNADKLLPADFTFEVLFLAPASTCNLTAKTFAAHQHRISNLRMFTMTDENEKKDQLAPVLYPHSLLYFASGVVEPEIDMPIVGMERFYDMKKFPKDQFPAVATVRDYMKAKRSIPGNRQRIARYHGLPPMLIHSWELLIRQSRSRYTTVPIGSLSDKISDTVVSTMPWLMCRVALITEDRAETVPQISFAMADRVLANMTRQVLDAGHKEVESYLKEQGKRLDPIENAIFNAMSTVNRSGDLIKTKDRDEAAEELQWTDDTRKAIRQVMTKLPAPTYSIARSALSLAEKLKDRLEFNPLEKGKEE